MSTLKFFSLITAFILIGTITSFSGGIPRPETDNNENNSLFAFYDLRDRESFLQVTNTGSDAARIHVQIFNVGNLCNENDFFDNYTPNDTHVYNMRDILTNDGNPSGVDLPEDAYGIVAFSVLDSNDEFTDAFIVGNFRIFDNSGYEYRTNMIAQPNSPFGGNVQVYFANFNQEGGVTLSDVVGLLIAPGPTQTPEEWDASNILNTFLVFDIDIFDNNEVPLSCRDIILACVKPDDPIVDELLAIDELDGTNGATAASFEYGINNTISHSKGGELLCPGNVIGEGFIRLNQQGSKFPPNSGGGMFPAFIGLNNGNGRGSMDSLWELNTLTFPPPG